MPFGKKKKDDGKKNKGGGDDDVQFTNPMTQPVSFFSGALRSVVC